MTYISVLGLAYGSSGQPLSDPAKTDVDNREKAIKAGKRNFTLIIVPVAVTVWLQA